MNLSFQFHQRRFKGIFIIYFGARHSLTDAANRHDILLETCMLDTILDSFCQTKYFIFFSQNPINSTYVFLLTLLIQLFGYCTCGQLVLNKVGTASAGILFFVFSLNAYIRFQGDNVCRAIYCSNWYKIADSKQRRWIQMFILGTQKPNGLSAMNIFQFSFVSLTDVILRIFLVLNLFNEFICRCFCETDFKIGGQLHCFPSKCNGLSGIIGLG